ncbi:MAG: 3-hydroxyacyl-CoA dehydrogenase family protein [Deltaproteobacteria bacterium]|nr:MAG: 3-hydroxyacyl-CoA dehydrogenase family protein [Deltaproteobacteria bacterium]
MKVEQIKKIAIIGAGIMGHGIGLTYALGGYQVVLNDIDDEILKTAMSHIKNNLEIFVENGLISQATIDETLSRITTTTNLKKAVEDADFVTEAVTEDVRVKKEVFNKLDIYSPDHAILASNTSSLVLKNFTVDTKRKDKILITHWFNPPHIVPVVEVVRGEETSTEAFETIYALLKKVRKIPVRVNKEIPGFLINRIQAAMMREIWSLWEQEIATPEDIDLAVKGSFGFRLAAIGPLETCDLGGLDLWYSIGERLFKVINNSHAPPKALKEKIERGEFGIKSGKGFFDYGIRFSEAGLDDAIKNRDRKFISLLKLLYPEIGLARP